MTTNFVKLLSVAAISLAVVASPVLYIFVAGVNQGIVESDHGMKPYITPAGPVAPVAPVVGEQWYYYNKNDEMSEGYYSFALVQSSNTVNFSSPYKGEQHATLILRKDPDNAKNVMFSIEEGQILCTSYSGCSVSVRFDNKPTESFSASRPEDHSTNVIFLKDANTFIKRASKAKTVKIAVTIYQESTNTFTFDVSGLDTSKLGN